MMVVPGDTARMRGYQPDARPLRKTHAAGRSTGVSRPRERLQALSALPPHRVRACVPHHLTDILSP